MNTNKSLTQRFELNEFTYTSDLVQLQSRIYQHPDTYLATVSRRSFILRAYQQLCQWRIELDEFFRIGDIGSPVDHHAPALHLTALFALDRINTPDACLWVCDMLQQQYVVWQWGDWDMLIQSLTDRGVEIFVL